LRANLAFDNSLPSALRELHKLQAIQMLQQQQQNHQHHQHHQHHQQHQHQLRQRRPNKQHPEERGPQTFASDHLGHYHEGTEQRGDEVADVLGPEDLAAGEDGLAETPNVRPEATPTPGSDEELEEEDDLLAEEILAESKEVQVSPTPEKSPSQLRSRLKTPCSQEETENLANNPDASVQFFPPVMNIELIKVRDVDKHLLVTLCVGFCFFLSCTFLNKSALVFGFFMLTFFYFWLMFASDFSVGGKIMSRGVCRAI
jgi:hypothetical protein